MKTILEIEGAKIRDNPWLWGATLAGRTFSKCQRRNGNFVTQIEFDPDVLEGGLARVEMEVLRVMKVLRSGDLGSYRVQRYNRIGWEKKTFFPPTPEEEMGSRQESWLPINIRTHGEEIIATTPQLWEVKKL